MIKPLAWDSHFFKKKVGEVWLEPNDPSSLDTMGYDLLYVKSEHPMTFQMEGFQESFRETKWVFSKEIPERRLTKNPHIKSIFSTVFSKKDLYPLAFESGHYSRFRLDPKFSEKDFKKLYMQWIDNSFEKLIAEDIFVYEASQKLLGFVSFQLKKSKGVIGLIAVAEEARGMGVGAALMEAVEDYLVKHHINQLDIPTQAHNQTACNFYRKMGYHVKESTEIYHFWKV
ncbi:MAG: GNAT family N-acetyltransferase [Flavobacteriaceae bacterium]